MISPKTDLEPGCKKAGSLLVLTETRAGFAVSCTTYSCGISENNSLVKYILHKISPVRETCVKNYKAQRRNDAFIQDEQ